MLAGSQNSSFNCWQKLNKEYAIKKAIIIIFASLISLSSNAEIISKRTDDGLSGWVSTYYEYGDGSYESERLPNVVGHCGGLIFEVPGLIIAFPLACPVALSQMPFKSKYEKYGDLYGRSLIGIENCIGTAGYFITATPVYVVKKIFYDFPKLFFSKNNVKNISTKSGTSDRANK